MKPYEFEQLVTYRPFCDHYGEDRQKDYRKVTLKFCFDDYHRLKTTKPFFSLRATRIYALK